MSKSRMLSNLSFGGNDMEDNKKQPLDTIYKLKNDQQWQLLEQKLRMPRSGFASVKVPIDFF